MNTSTHRLGQSCARGRIYVTALSGWTSSQVPACSLHVYRYLSFSAVNAFLKNAGLNESALNEGYVNFILGSLLDRTRIKIVFGGKLCEEPIVVRQKLMSTNHAYLRLF